MRYGSSRYASGYNAAVLRPEVTGLRPAESGLGGLIWLNHDVWLDQDYTQCVALDRAGEPDVIVYDRREG